MVDRKMKQLEKEWDAAEKRFSEPVPDPVGDLARFLKRSWTESALPAIRRTFSFKGRTPKP